MDFLESCLSPSSDISSLLSSSSIDLSEFNLGWVSSHLLSTPSLAHSRLLLQLLPSLSSPLKDSVLLVFLESLNRLLQTTNKVEAVESLFECSLSMAQEVQNAKVTEKCRTVLESLIEQVNCDLGLSLLRHCLSHVRFDYPGKDLTADSLNSLDIAIKADPATRFKAVSHAYAICSSLKRYTVLNSIAFRCIDYVLRYEIPDFRGYCEMFVPKLIEFKAQFTYEQRLKLSRIYASGMQKVGLTVDNNVIRTLEAMLFSDRSCVNSNMLEFTFLVEDVLQFGLADHVVRNRIKSLHGKYRGKPFARQLLMALKAVIDDEPGYKAMEIISRVLKPLKLLSKTEYKTYRKNEKKIECHEPAYNPLPEIASHDFSSVDKAVELYEKVIANARDTPTQSQINAAIELIRNIASEKHKELTIKEFGAARLGTLTAGSNIDLNISSEKIEDKTAFLYALQILLGEHGRVELVPSRSLALLKYHPRETSFGFNITVNNDKAVHSTELISHYLHEPRVKELVKVVKLWANSVGLKEPKKGTYSGYEWTLLVIGFLQSEKVMPLGKEAAAKGFEIRQRNEELFRSFIYFCYNIGEKTVKIDEGVVSGNNKTLLTVVNPADESVFKSKVKTERKQGRAVLQVLVDTLSALNS